MASGGRRRRVGRAVLKCALAKRTLPHSLVDTHSLSDRNFFTGRPGDCKAVGAGPLRAFRPSSPEAVGCTLPSCWPSPIAFSIAGCRCKPCPLTSAAAAACRPDTPTPRHTMLRAASTALRRGLATAAGPAGGSSGHSGLVELRQYELKVEGIKVGGRRSTHRCRGSTASPDRSSAHACLHLRLPAGPPDAPWHRHPPAASPPACPAAAGVHAADAREPGPAQAPAALSGHVFLRHRRPAEPGGPPVQLPRLRAPRPAPRAGGRVARVAGARARARGWPRVRARLVSSRALRCPPPPCPPPPCPPPPCPPHLPQDGYLAFSRACLLSQESSIFVPAAGVLAAAGAAPLHEYVAPPRPAGGPPPVYELRQYQVGAGCWAWG